MGKKSQHIVFFVEGETEKEFYTYLLRKKLNGAKIKASYQIVNLKCIGQFGSKVHSKLKNEIIPKQADKKIKVVCCYDTDVFEFAQKPPVDWDKVKKDVENLGVNDFFEIKAKSSIEDWLLKDKQGLCKFLKINVPQKLEGNDGFKKISNLFKKGNKIYQKGTYVHKFMDSIDIDNICNQIKDELSPIDKVFGLKKN